MKFKKIILIILVFIGVLIVSNPNSNDFENYINSKDNPMGLCEFESANQLINCYVFSIYESHYECYLSNRKYIVDKNDTSFNYLENIKADGAAAAYVGISHIGILDTFIDL